MSWQYITGYDGLRYTAVQDIITAEGLWGNTLSVLSSDDPLTKSGANVVSVTDLKGFEHYKQEIFTGGNITENAPFGLNCPVNTYFKADPSNISDFRAANSQALTFFFSLKVPGVLHGDLLSIASTANPSTTAAEHFGLAYDSTKMYVHSGNGPADITTGRTLTTGEKITIIIQHNGTTGWDFYLDDVLVGATTLTPYSTPYSMLALFGNYYAGINGVFRDMIAIKGAVTRTNITNINNVLKTRINQL